jgi:hypothetical protein
MSQGRDIVDSDQPSLSDSPVDSSVPEWSLPQESFLRPRLRLFLSVDLVGSTALKQKQNNPEESSEQEAIKPYDLPWMRRMVQFYQRTDTLFVEHWGKAVNNMKGVGISDDVECEIWKSQGDEIIYTQIS